VASGVCLLVKFLDAAEQVAHARTTRQAAGRPSIYWHPSNTHSDLFIAQCERDRHMISQRTHARTHYTAARPSSSRSSQLLS
jgi:hypothetical protein